VDFIICAVNLHSFVEAADDVTELCLGGYGAELFSPRIVPDFPGRRLCFSWLVPLLHYLVVVFFFALSVFRLSLLQHLGIT